MKFNGKYFPFEEGKEENNPEKDFPIEDVVHNFTGKERKFKITFHEIGLGYIVDALEVGKYEGYQFSAFDSMSPYLALGKLRDKMGKMLSSRHLIKREGRWSMLHDTLIGRISYDDGKAVFVVDGIPLSLDELGKIASSHEGWQFRLQIVDRTEDV